MCTRKRSGPRIEPWGTPAKTGLHDDVCPFKTILWNLPEMPIGLSLYSKPSCQTLSNALDISKKTDLTSRDGLQSKASNISCVITSNWFIHELDGRNPDWFGFSSFSSNKKL